MSEQNFPAGWEARVQRLIAQYKQRDVATQIAEDECRRQLPRDYADEPLRRAERLERTS